VQANRHFQSSRHKQEAAKGQKTPVLLPFIFCDGERVSIADVNFQIPPGCSSIARFPAPFAGSPADFLKPWSGSKSGLAFRCGSKGTWGEARGTTRIRKVWNGPRQLAESRPTTLPRHLFSKVLVAAGCTILNRTGVSVPPTAKKRGRPWEANLSLGNQKRGTWGSFSIRNPSMELDH